MDNIQEIQGICKFTQETEKRQHPDKDFRFPAEKESWEFGL